MFYLTKIENGACNVPEPEFYDMTEGEACKNGEALVLSAGKLTKCAQGAKPAYVAMNSVSAEAEKRKTPCARLESAQLWRAPCEAETLPAIGARVNVSEDAMGVGAEAEDGAFTVCGTDGACLLVRLA